MNFSALKECDLKKILLILCVSFLSSCGTKDLSYDQLVERNFRVDQKVQEVDLCEKKLEFLYLEGKDYLCLDIDSLDEVIVSSKVVGDKVNFLKEGIQLKAMFYGDSIFSVELPQFLELMIVKVEDGQASISVSSASKVAILETGAKVEVPLFIEIGDIIKVDTHLGEYVQRI